MADEKIGFIGTGRMGRPMATRLARAGYPVTVFDRDLEAAAQVTEAQQAPNLASLAASSSTIITMLPDGGVVREALAEARQGMQAGTLVIDMSSSAPLGTITLGRELYESGIPLLDAPVSGGVARAVLGKLTIMAGGAAEDIERARLVLEVMGSVVRVGELGAGHAMKALNNYVSSAGLAAACEAVLVGRRFGLDAETMLRVLNASTGQNFATSNKIAQFVLSGTYASGFALDLMAKDVRTAAELARDMHVGAPTLECSAALWTQAQEHLAANADHTEIFRYLDQLNPEP